ncbi:MAG: 16S rRNA (adenine(1518)-N(6)/adenine(1519)-N(6))-dimethyltransferase RsmA [Salibacteraceae bacterium]
MDVKAKKHLGQHFLTSDKVACDIVHAVKSDTFTKVIEVGPGMGILTKELIKIYGDALSVIDLDGESIKYLRKNFPELGDRIIEGDFLEMRLSDITDEKVALVGNYPYNISTQIMFKVYENKDHIVECSGMFQKEVAARIASGPGNKQYGVTSVLLQTWFDIEYLFTVGPEHFNPPPKVDSGIIRLLRNSRVELPFPDKFYKRVVKTAFGQRRKTLRNGLKSMLNEFKVELPEKYISQRPEQLGVEEFLEITQMLYDAMLTSKK